MAPEQVGEKNMDPAAPAEAEAQMKASVEALCAMGFAEPEVLACLQAAFGNADRAVCDRK